MALDEHDLSVKRMQSFVTLMPGETTGCVGCHEDRTQAPPSGAGLLALRREPSRIEPVAGVPDVLDFRRDLQPILDRRCVSCHSPGKPEGCEFDLTAAPDPKEKTWTRSYAALTRRAPGGKSGLGFPAVRRLRPQRRRQLSAAISGDRRQPAHAVP